MVIQYLNAHKLQPLNQIEKTYKCINCGVENTLSKIRKYSGLCPNKSIKSEKLRNRNESWKKINLGDCYTCKKDIGSCYAKDVQWWKANKYCSLTCLKIEQEKEFKEFIENERAKRNQAWS